MSAKRHSERLRRLAKIRPELSKVVYAAADELAVEAEHSITVGSVSGKNHVVSAPGDPPNSNLHELDRSIHVERVDDLTARVVADAGHAAPLELGTSKMAARPFLGPAAARIRPVMNRKITAVIKKLKG